MAIMAFLIYIISKLDLILNIGFQFDSQNRYFRISQYHIPYSCQRYLMAITSSHAKTRFLICTMKQTRILLLYY